MSQEFNTQYIMFCPQCGKENKNIARFCVSCGVQLTHPLTAGVKIDTTITNKKFNFLKTWTYSTGLVTLVFLIIFYLGDVFSEGSIIENLFWTVALSALIGVVISFIIKWVKKVKSETKQVTDARYKGVGGWLYIPLFNFLILYPIVAIIELFTIETWAAIIDVALAGYMIYTGYLLLKCKPGALKHTKLVLGAVIVLGIIGIISYSSSDISEADMTEGYTSFTRAIIWSLIWVWYFSVSKRVKNTYTS